MLILTIRTEKPDAEIGLYNDGLQLAYVVWPAHRRLAETLHAKINELLNSQNKNLSDIEGVAIFKGPGSFTGLRIGITVANALAGSLRIPIIASEDPKWLEASIVKLQTGENEKIALPEYGALPNITVQKK